ncbi:sigma-70 family RNA polymerase sigma factor [soil metagenome]
MPEGSSDVTQMLVAYAAGNREVLDELLPLVYDELRSIAANYMSRERVGHTLQPTALVNEAYLRLMDQKQVDWRNRAQFFGLSATMMRRILVNHAEARRAEKRGGAANHVGIEDVTVFFDEQNLDLLALNEALTRFAEQDDDKARLVEMKYFGGMTNAEISEATGRSTASVERDWVFARTWLFRALTEKDG